MNQGQRRAPAGATPDRTDAQALAETVAEAVRFAHARRPDEAERLLRQVLAIDPRHVEGLRQLGVVAAQAGRFDEAVALLGQAAALKPDYAEVHDNLAAALQRLGRNEDSMTASRRAITLKPGLPQARYNYGVTLQALGQNAEAAVAYQHAVQLKPDYAPAYYNLGVMLQELGRGDEAIAAYRRAVELKPNDEDALLRLATTLQGQGDGAEALKVLDRGLTTNPAWARAWYTRSDLKTFTRDDPDIGAMESLLASADARGLGLEDRLNLEFALGKAWMDVGQPDRAFAYLDAGNRRKRATFVHDGVAVAEQNARIANAFSADLIRDMAGAGDPSDLPIFVVGMPRSGTSLIEQILASHPDIHGAGELSTLREVVARHGQPSPTATQNSAPLTREQAAAIGRAYVEQVAALAPGKRRVVDKLPGNFGFAGLIHLILPNARIIHCRRDAIDTCLSCYSKKFSEPQTFAYHLHDLGLFYRSYAALMGHWRDVLPPDRYIEVDYEEVVSDLETQARRLIAFCGLEWNAACLDFHNTRREVRTASVNEVRRPLYRTSVGRWKPYERHLAPLIEALGPVRR